MQIVNTESHEYIKPSPMSLGSFSVSLFLSIAILASLIIGVLLIVAKFGMGASIGNALLGLTIGCGLIFSVMYMLMESDRSNKELEVERLAQAKAMATVNSLKNVEVI